MECKLEGGWESRGRQAEGLGVGGVLEDKLEEECGTAFDGGGLEEVDGR